MSGMHTTTTNHEQLRAVPPTPPAYRFPVELARGTTSKPTGCEHAENVLEAIESVSRRIDDLARELNCLGWFDDGDGGPRAA